MDEFSDDLWSEGMGLNFYIMGSGTYKGYENRMLSYKFYPYELDGFTITYRGTWDAPGIQHIGKLSLLPSAELTKKPTIIISPITIEFSSEIFSNMSSIEIQPFNQKSLKILNK